MDAPKVKVVRHRFEGRVCPGEYDVLLDGEKIGRVRRNDGVSTGYWGRWRVGSWGTDTRKDAVAYVVRRHLERVSC